MPANDSGAPTRSPGPVSLLRQATELPFAGIPTFMKLPICLTPADLKAGNIDMAIGGAPWDGTNMNRSGAQWGPRCVRTSDIYVTPHDRPNQDVRVDGFQHVQLCDYGDAEILVGDTQGTYANIRSFVAEIAQAGVIPVIVGGDHGITWPAATAVFEKHLPNRVGLFHIDAHADTAPDFQGNIYSHASPIRRLVETGMVRGEDIVQIGLRGYFPDDDVLQWMRDSGIRSHFMTDVDRDGFNAVLDRALGQAAEAGIPVYLTVDVDAADPAYAPGTSAPEPGGLTSRQMLRTVRRVCSEIGIVGMDVVELNPLCDSGITARLVQGCIMEAITGVAMRRLDRSKD